jgi:outer membrane protein
MTKYVLPVALSLLSIISAPANSEPLIVKAWNGVKSHSAEYASLEANHQAAAASRELAKSTWLPSITANSMTGQASSVDSIVGAQFSAPALGTMSGIDFKTIINNGNFYQWNVMAQQPIWDVNRLVDRHIAYAQANLIDSQYRLQRQQIMLKTVNLLTKVISNQISYEAITKSRDSTILLTDSAKLQFENGEVPITELREAEAQSDLLRVSELEIQQQLADANIEFSDFTGITLSTENKQSPSTPISSNLSQELSIEPLSVWIKDAQKNSPKIVIAQLNAQISEDDEKRFGAFDGIKVNVIGQINHDNLTGRGDFGGAGLKSDMSSIGIQLTVPLFTGGGRSAQRHMAHARYQATQQDLESIRQQVELEVHTAWMRVNTMRAKSKALLKSAESAQLRLDSTRLGHSIGDKTMIDLLSAESSSIQANATYQRSKCEELVAILNLYFAAGKLDDQALDFVTNSGYRCGD